jgi:hypothetical protein
VIDDPGAYVIRMFQRMRRRWRSVARFLGFEEVLSNVDLMGELQGWLLNLPWVTEWAPTVEDPQVRRFAIECDPLGWQSAWLLIGQFDGLDGMLEIHVVLPERMAQRGLEAGWALPLVPLNAYLSVVSVLTPTTARELGALEDLLTVAYNLMFETNASVR